MDKGFLSIKLREIMQTALLHLCKCVCVQSFKYVLADQASHETKWIWIWVDILWLSLFKLFFHILGVYELVTFLMKPGGPALWGEAFERAVNAHVNQGYAKLIGVFHSEYGILNRGTDVHFFSNFYVYWWPIHLLGFFSKSSYVIDKFLYFYHFKELINCLFPI